MTSPPRKSRERLLAAATVVIAILVFLSAAEIALQFLPVASGLRTLPVTADQPVMRFAPGRRFVHSFGWDLAMVNTGRTNNAGFVNDQDYRVDDPKPLLAVIGDSYIEATMVPYADTMQGRLAKALDGKLRVYSFGASGAPLSQYLIWARHAVQAFHAQALVINVVGNDFDESLAAYKSGPGLWLYAPQSDGTLALQLTEHRPSLVRQAMQHSALARYLFLNLHIGSLTMDPRNALRSIGLHFERAAPTPRYAGNTAASADQRRIADSMAAIDAFFRDLPRMTDLAPDRVLFLVDGFRYPAAADAGHGTYFDQMRQAFRQEAERRGYQAIDLDTLFFQQPSPIGTFEDPRDGHWNAAGHAVAARAVLQSKLLATLKP